jgi:hypothetical protein
MIKRINTIAAVSILVGMGQCVLTGHTGIIQLLIFSIPPAVAMVLQLLTDMFTPSATNVVKRVGRIENDLANLDRNVHSEIFALASEISVLKENKSEKTK